MRDTVDYERLDEYQQAFVRSEAADVRVLAPAGSGKTETLLWRCQKVHERAAESTRFLIVTFTRAARAELKMRLSSEEFGTAPVSVMTLNRYGWALIRRKYDAPLLVTQPKDKAEWVRTVVDSTRPHSPVAAALKAQQRPGVVAGLLDRVDDLKNFGFRLDRKWTKKQFLGHWHQLELVGLRPQVTKLIEALQKLGILIDPDRAALDRRLHGAEPGRGGGESLVGELYDRFFGFAEDVFREMHRKQRFTFDDQKYVALLLLEERVLRCAAPPDDRWTHVLVDEFQDISPLDLRLVKAIAERSGAALTIVGDDDQAIYEWRGGAPTYLLEPEREFGREFKTFVLERNYRCPRNLVAAADRLIRHNRNRHPKRMQAHSKSNAEIVPLESPDSAVSVRDVMKEVERFRRDSSTGDRMALLSRKKAQLVPYQILLADADIRFNAADDLKIFLSSAFDKLKRVLEIRARCDAEEITARQVVEDTIHVCRQVRPGDRDRRTIEQFKRELRRVQPSGFAEACEAVRALQRRFDLDADYAGALSSMFAAKTGEEAIRVIRSRFEALHQDFGRGATDIFFQDPPFFYLGAVAKRFGSDFHAFLRTLDRAKESAATHEGEELAADRSQLHDKPIELATALRAKGKQFHTVVILDANAGVWPSRLAETDMEKEAERRLFYVAMTRAQRKLIVSWYKVDAEAKPTAPSPYIAEAALGGTPSSSVRATPTPGQSLPLKVKKLYHPAQIGPARTAP